MNERICVRCGKKIVVAYIVAGIYPEAPHGPYGKQCALEACQGRPYLIRKQPQAVEVDEEIIIPF